MGAPSRNNHACAGKRNSEHAQYTASCACKQLSADLSVRLNKTAILFLFLFFIFIYFFFFLSPLPVSNVKRVWAVSPGLLCLWVAGQRSPPEACGVYI